MTVLPFSDTDYDKLKRAVFPTIRRRDKYGDVGETVTVEHGPRGNREEIGQAEIIAKEKEAYNKLGGAFLRFDTQSSTASEAYNHINEFYQKPIQPREELTVYWLRWGWA